jgi:hypothetical protein
MRRSGSLFDAVRRMDREAAAATARNGLTRGSFVALEIDHQLDDFTAAPAARQALLAVSNNDGVAARLWTAVIQLDDAIPIEQLADGLIPDPDPVSSMRDGQASGSTIRSARAVSARS